MSSPCTLNLALEAVGHREHLASAERFRSPLSFGEDGSGEVYVLDESGRVWKIVERKP